MKTSIYLFISCALVCNKIGFALDPEQIQQIDNIINDLFIPANYVPGMSLSIVQDGETVLSKGYGKLDIEKGIDAANDTLFSIGSISKSFIATLVVKALSERYPIYGELALDIPIADLDPAPYQKYNFTFSDRYRAEETTFRDLLSHRTCLLSPDFQLLFGEVNSTREYTYRSRYQHEVCGMRGGWVYNNALYALAGELVASLNGKSLEQLVREFMLEIGMQNSTTIDTSASYENLPNMSQGYYRKDGQIHKFNIKLLRKVANGLGAGGILSTSSDMAKYASFHLNKGKVDGRQVVSEEALSWMYKPSAILRTLDGKQSDMDNVSGTYAYALGFQLSLYDGYSAVSHGGYWPPFQSEIYLFPANNLSIFLTTNGPGAIVSSVDQSFVVASIFDIIIGEIKTVEMNAQLPFPLPDIENAIGNFKNKESELEIKSRVAETKRISKIEFEDVIGLYGDKLTGDATITLDSEDTSFLQFNMGEFGIGRLLPVNGLETKFLIEWKTDFLHHYYTFPPEMIPVPVVHVDFLFKSFILLVDDAMVALLVRDATLETLPVIPWPENSCGPIIPH